MPKIALMSKSPVVGQRILLPNEGMFRSKQAIKRTKFKTTFFSIATSKKKHQLKGNANQSPTHIDII